MSNVDHPKHYHKETGFEVIDVINHWNLNFELGNAIKYIARAGLKDKQKVVEDLNKAIWYINYEIKKHERSDKMIKTVTEIQWDFDGTEFEGLDYSEALELSQLSEEVIGEVEVEVEDEYTAYDEIKMYLEENYGCQVIDFVID